MVHAYLCIFLCTKMMTFRRNIKMLPQRLPILGFFNIMQTRCQTPWKKCKDTIQQVSFPTTRVMRRTCLNSNRLSLSHSAWDRDSSDNLTFLVCPVTSNPTSWLLFVHSTSTATQQYLTRAPWSSTTAVRVRVRKTPSACQQCWPESFCKSGKFLWQVHFWLKNFRLSGWTGKFLDFLKNVWVI